MILRQGSAQFAALHGTGPGSRHESGERDVINTFARDCWDCTGLVLRSLRLLEGRDEGKPVLQQVL